YSKRFHSKLVCGECKLKGSKENESEVPSLLWLDIYAQCKNCIRITSFSPRSAHGSSFGMAPRREEEDFRHLDTVTGLTCLSSRHVFLR
ncbi:hypothetical protein PENTCL1PPCAC_5279, partial [Pristionchus entomophagus]